MASVELPDWEVDEALVRVHQGACAHCAGPGPVDAYGAHRVVSMVIISQFSTPVQVSCAACGRRMIAKNLAITALAGWWGVPWGVLLTPVFLVRNLIALASVRRGGPSKLLREIVTHDLVAKRLADAPREGDLTPPPQLDIPYTGKRRPPPQKL